MYIRWETVARALCEYHLAAVASHEPMWWFIGGPDGIKYKAIVLISNVRGAHTHTHTSIGTKISTKNDLFSYSLELNENKNNEPRKSKTLMDIVRLVMSLVHTSKW